jgi:hypothetical protein
VSVGNSREIVGGMRVRANISWPLARLTVDETGSVTIGPHWRWVRFFAPTYGFRLENVEHIDVVMGAVGGWPGIQFILTAPAKPTLRRGLFALLWPRSTRRPIFWIRPAELDRALSLLPTGSVTRSNRKVWTS